MGVDCGAGDFGIVFLGQTKNLISFAASTGGACTFNLNTRAATAVATGTETLFGAVILAGGFITVAS